MTDRLGVCVIGAGRAGLAVCRALRDNGVDYICVERGSAVGGVWWQSGTGRPGAGYRSLRLNSSKRLFEYSGFAMPAGWPSSPGHAQVAKYLRDFSTVHELDERIELDTEVVAAYPGDDGNWAVVTHSAIGGTRERTFRQVIVATGPHTEPLPLPVTPGDFTGKKLHIYDYVEPSQFRDKSVVVVGIGASGADLAVELSRVARRTFLSVRRSRHVIPRDLFGIPIGELMASPRLRELPWARQLRMMELGVRLRFGRLADYGFSEPDHPLLAHDLTISDDLLRTIKEGAIEVRPGIASLQGESVEFTDGSIEKADAIVYCTGYRMAFPFLPPDAVFTASGQVGLYRLVVAAHYPGLFFAGLGRSPTGGVVHLMEAQARWIAQLAMGAPLPPGDMMHAETCERLEQISAAYGTGAFDSLKVDPDRYIALLERHLTAVDTGKSSPAA